MDMKSYFGMIGSVVVIAVLIVALFLAGCTKQQPAKPVSGVDVDIDGTSTTVVGEKLDVSGLDVNDDDLGFGELDTLENDLEIVE